MDTIAVAEVQRGDLLLVTQHPTDPLAALILKYDRSPGHFSHCGVAMGGGSILSAFPHLEEPYLTRLRQAEIGGLRVDPFQHFFGEGQAIHRLTVPEATRDRVIAELGDADDPPPRADFSILKIVLVAAALHALAPDNVEAIGKDASDRVVRATLAAAWAWDEVPEYYCAEFVARVAGWRFELRHLVPPPPPATRSLWQPLVRLGVGVVRHLLAKDGTAQQKELLSDFVAEVWRSDPEFFEEGVRTTIDSILEGIGKLWTGEDEPARRRGLLGTGSPDPTQELPRCLVTPRMLRMTDPGEPPMIEGSPDIGAVPGAGRSARSRPPLSTSARPVLD